MKKKIVIIATFVILLTLGACIGNALQDTGTVAASRTEPQRWEYYVIVQADRGGIESSASVLMEKLNELGNEGWELIQYEYGASFPYIFKRQIQ